MTPREQMALDLERARWLLLRLWSVLDQGGSRLPPQARAEAERTIFPPLFAAIGDALTGLNAVQELFWGGSDAALTAALGFQGKPAGAAEPLDLTALIDAALVRRVQAEAEAQSRSPNMVIEQALRHYFGCRQIPERIMTPNHGAVNGLKTHCLRGHPFTPENIYWRDGRRRECRTCWRVADACRAERRSRERKRARAAKRLQVAA